MKSHPLSAAAGVIRAEVATWRSSMSQQQRKRKNPWRTGRRHGSHTGPDPYMSMTRGPRSYQVPPVIGYRLASLHATASPDGRTDSNSPKCNPVCHPALSVPHSSLRPVHVLLLSPPRPPHVTPAHGPRPRTPPPLASPRRRQRVTATSRRGTTLSDTSVPHPPDPHVGDSRAPLTVSATAVIQIILTGSGIL